MSLNEKKRREMMAEKKRKEERDLRLEGLAAEGKIVAKSNENEKTRYSGSLANDREIEQVGSVSYKDGRYR